MAQQPQQHVLALQTLGSIDPFDPNDQETFTQWFARFNMFCGANLIGLEPLNDQGQVLPAMNRRRAIFLTSIGKRAYGVLHSAALPNNPSDFSIPELAAVLKSQFENPGMIEANRLRFHQRLQGPSESVFDFVNAIQELAAQCDFDQYYDSALKTRLISGLRHQDTKSKLLTTPNLSYAEAKVMAI